MIAAARESQQQLAKSAEQPDAPVTVEQSAIEARRRKRNSEVDDLLEPSQPPTAKARSSNTARKRHLASTSPAPHLPESDSDENPLLACSSSGSANQPAALAGFGPRRQLQHGGAY